MFLLINLIVTFSDHVAGMVSCSSDHDVRMTNFAANDDGNLFTTPRQSAPGAGGDDNSKYGWVRTEMLHTE